LQVHVKVQTFAELQIRNVTGDRKETTILSVEIRDLRMHANTSIGFS